MPQILKPHTAQINPQNRRTTRLFFEGFPPGDFYMRGSIAWPEGRQEGFALMAGQDLKSRQIIIFEEFRFWTIGHWMNDDGTLRAREDGKGYHLGLIEFLQSNLARYKCASYFWGGQHVDIWQRFGREVYSNDMTPKRIELIEVPYVSEIGDSLLQEKFKTRKFKGQTDSILSRSVAQYMAMQTADTGKDGAVHALMALLAGFEHLPWVGVG